MWFIVYKITQVYEVDEIFSFRVHYRRYESRFRKVNSDEILCPPSP